MKSLLATLRLLLNELLLMEKLYLQFKKKCKVFERSSMVVSVPIAWCFRLFVREVLKRTNSLVLPILI
jgi:hypothetical protein